MKVKFVIDIPGSVFGTEEPQEYGSFINLEFRPQLADLIHLADFLPLKFPDDQQNIHEYIVETDRFMITEATILKENGETILECYLEPLSQIEDEDDMLGHLSQHN